EDGVQEVVVGDAAIEPDGSLLWQTGGEDGYTAVADLDGDGRPEVVVAGADGDVRALVGASGKTLWTRAVPGVDGYGATIGPPSVADFEGDGRREIAVPIRGGVVLFDASGEILWTFTRGSSFGWWDGVSAFDLDGDGAWEVVDHGEDAVYILRG